MKKKNPAKHRNRFEGQIANAAHNNPGKALALATYGPDADKVVASFERNPQTFCRCLTKDGISERGVSELIQELLFLDDCSKNPALLSDINATSVERASVEQAASLKRERLEIEMGELLGYLITMRDSQSIRKLADILDKASATFKDAKSPRCDRYRTPLLLAKIQGIEPNISSLANEEAEKRYPAASKPGSNTAALAWLDDKRTYRENYYRKLARLAKKLGVTTTSDKPGRKPDK